MRKLVSKTEVCAELRKDPSPTRVAEKLGCDVSTVYRQAKGMDLGMIRRAKKTGIQLPELIKVMDLEFSRKEIAEKLGCTVNYINQVAGNV